MTSRSTILIVDDQRLAQKSLEMLLGGDEYRLAFAGNGQEALTQAIQLIPDVILLDVMMPGMDGFEVCRRLRAHSLLAEVPVLMITSLDDRESRLKGIAVGADDFISKPFDGVELQTRVKSITRLNRYRRLLIEKVRFRWVVDRAEEGYLIVNAVDKVLYANPRARVYLNLPDDESEPISDPFLVLARQQYHCEPREAWESWPAETTGESVRYLVRPETDVARAFWLQVDTLNLPSGRDMAGMILLRDVTEQMNTLRDMRGFDRAITHKLRTPMGHITSSLDLLAKYYREQVSHPDVAELFETAHKGGKRLGEEIEDILRYLHHLPALAESGAAFTLSHLQSLIALINAELELKSLSVTYRDCPIGTRVVLSERAVELMLWEVLENAKKFHPQQAPSVEISVTCGSEWVTLRVSDDGLTLSPEQLTEAWAPYYQGEKHFTGEVAGMGLGLTMVANLVWGVGGTCRLYNRTPGPGVVVEIVLPTTDAAG
ncbi:MAG: response regulator [Anaerolineae bacterium]|nr:response regulator [Anaerolineae bacterium]